MMYIEASILVIDIIYTKKSLKNTKIVHYLYFF